MNLSAGAALLPKCQLMFTGATVRLVSWTCAAVLGAAVCGMARAADADSQASPPTATTLLPQAHSIRHPRENAIFERRWGVELIGVHLASAGYMLEFRYRVVDAQKAKPLFQRQTKPFLIDERTGLQFTVPAPAKVGPLRNSNPPLPGRTYWMFFANPGKTVKAGDLVTVVIGEFRAPGLVVN